MPTEKMLRDSQGVRAGFLRNGAATASRWYLGMAAIGLVLWSADSRSQMLQQFYQGIQPPGNQPCVQVPGGAPCPPQVPTASDYSRGGTGGVTSGSVGGGSSIPTITGGTPPAQRQPESKPPVTMET